MDKAEADRMRTLLCEAVSTLCRSGMRYTSAMRVEGLIAITVDEKDILVVNVNKTYENVPENQEESAEESGSSNVSNRKKRHEECDDETESVNGEKFRSVHNQSKRARTQTYTANDSSIDSFSQPSAQCIKIEIDSNSEDDDTKDQVSFEDSDRMLGFDGSEQLHLEQVQGIPNVSSEYDTSYGQQPGPSGLNFPEGALSTPGNQTDFRYAFPASTSQETFANQETGKDKLLPPSWQDPLPSFVGFLQSTDSKGRPCIQHEPLCDCCRELSWRRERHRSYCKKWRSKINPGTGRSDGDGDPTNTPIRKFWSSTPKEHEHVCECCTILAKKINKRKEKQDKGKKR